MKTIILPTISRAAMLTKVRNPFHRPTKMIKHAKMYKRVKKVNLE